MYLKSQNLISQKLQGMYTQGLNVVKRYCRPAYCDAELGVTDVFFRWVAAVPRWPSPFWPLIKPGKGPEDHLWSTACRHRSIDRSIDRGKRLESTSPTANDARHTCNHSRAPPVFMHSYPTFRRMLFRRMSISRMSFHPMAICLYSLSFRRMSFRAECQFAECHIVPSSLQLLPQHPR